MDLHRLELREQEQSQKAPQFAQWPGKQKRQASSESPKPGSHIPSRRLACQQGSAQLGKGSGFAELSSQKNSFLTIPHGHALLKIKGDADAVKAVLSHNACGSQVILLVFCHAIGGIGLNKVIYPLYIVVDNSDSMNKEIKGQRRIDLARQIPLALLRLYEEDVSLVKSLQVAFLTFNSTVNVVLPLGPIPALRELPSSLEAKSKTYFGKVFDKIYELIVADHAALDSQSKFMRPTVVLVTDGLPNDPPEERNQAFRRLVPLSKHTSEPDKTKFLLTPDIVMMGIAAAVPEVLEKYSTRPEGILMAASDTVDEQIRLLAASLKDTVATSLANPVLDPNQPWLNFISDDEYLP